MTLSTLTFLPLLLTFVAGPGIVDASAGSVRVVVGIEAGTASEGHLKAAVPERSDNREQINSQTKASFAEYFQC